ncbi:hypothetical protein [Kitasatospora sp. GP82]|uniref:hypothetical protein n=1 Tax=Kitasatospora sp. GP82 TaxID=3035089 RepID=UPI002473739F|nr:hypothetical protein [Kitasatospora sp. GP82]
MSLEDLEELRSSARTGGQDAGCCEVTVTEHLTLGGTVVRTTWHRPYCPTWSAR